MTTHLYCVIPYAVPALNLIGGVLGAVAIQLRAPDGFIDAFLDRLFFE